MSVIEKLKAAKQVLVDRGEEKKRLVWKLEQATDKLKNDFGCGTTEEAMTKLNALTIELDVLQAKLVEFDDEGKAILDEVA